MKSAKIFLKALHIEFNAKKVQLVNGKHRDSKEWVREFNSDISNIRENEAALRERDLCLLEVQKAYNNAMDLGLKEAELVDAYLKLVSISKLPLLNLILVPA